MYLFQTRSVSPIIYLMNKIIWSSNIHIFILNSLKTVRRTSYIFPQETQYLKIIWLQTTMPFVLKPQNTGYLVKDRSENVTQSVKKKRWQNVSRMFHWLTKRLNCDKLDVRYPIDKSIECLNNQCPSNLTWLSNKIEHKLAMSLNIT